MRRPICYVVGAGEDFGLDFVPQDGDMVIAADAGYRQLQAAGIKPQVVIGDFDSLGAAPAGEEIITLPKIKDITDTWAAIHLGMKKGYRRFFLYSCTGGRFEHTLANLQTLADLAQQGMEGRLFDKTQVITAISGGTIQFGPERKGFVSVFSYTNECTGVTIQGLKYPLENARLTSRFPLGVSNEFLGIPSSVTIGTGTALLVYDRKKKA